MLSSSAYQILNILTPQHRCAFVRRFVRHIVLYLVLLVLVLQIPEMMLPYYWSIDQLNLKMEHIEEQAFRYDTYFFGSSLTHSQIQPILFDSLFQSTDSYNLGVNGMRPPESFYVVNHFLKHWPEQQQLKYVFLEVVDVKPMDSNNQHSLRIRGTMSLDKLWYNTRHYYHEKDFQSIFSSYKVFIYSVFKYQMLNDMKKYLLRGKSDKKENRLIQKIQQQKGFLAMRDRKGVKKNLGHQLVWDVLDNKRLLDELNKNSLLLNQGKIKGKINPIYIQELQSINKKVLKLGGQLILLIPSRLSQNTLSHVESLHEIPCINLSNPSQYPNFYKMEYCSNPGHLNHRGSLEYTSALVKNMQELNLK